MKISKLYFIIVTGVLIVSCTNENAGTKNKKNKIDLTYDSVKIKLDIASLNYYDIFTIDTLLNELICYNNQTKSLDVFNLISNKISKHINLPVGRGPGEMSDQIEGIYFHNKDSLFIFHTYSISIFNSNLEETDKYNLYENFQAAPDYRYVINSSFQLKFVPVSNSIFLQNLYPAEIIDKHIHSSILSKLDLPSDEIIELPVQFSSMFKKYHGRVGFLRWLNLFSIKDDSLILSSQFDDEVIILDAISNNYRIINLSNQNDKITRLPENSTNQAWVEHAASNTHRFAFLFDKYRKVYYRFLWEGTKQNVNENSNNKMLDKPLSLEIYNENFQLLEKVKLQNYKYRINSWFIIENGLYISPTHPSMKNQDFDFLKFDIIKIHVK